MGLVNNWQIRLEERKLCPVSNLRLKRHLAFTISIILV